MRLLHVNKFLYRRGGAEGYMEDLAELQVAAGHEVAFFGMDHPENVHTEWSEHFPAHVELEPMPPGLGAKARGLGRMLWSTSAARGLEEVVTRFQPDVAHLHNVYHQLSPSVLRPLARHGVPTVMTLHDYKLACPSYQFLDHGRPCTACLDGHFRHAVARRCKDGSLLASSALAAESALHAATGAWRPVGAFVCPSAFMATKMGEGGIFPDRLHHVPHFFETDGVPIAARPGEGVLYAGRLSPEKGIDVLLDAVPALPAGTRALIAGDGPARLDLEARAASRAPERVAFLGRLSRDALHQLIRSVAAVVLPSRWYENQPMIVLEALACGVPVVGTAMGGTPELIDDGVHGRLVPPDDPVALAGALNELLAEPAVAHAMGQAGRLRVEAEFSPGRHLERLSAVYAAAGVSPALATNAT